MKFKIKNKYKIFIFLLFGLLIIQVFFFVRLVFQESVKEEVLLSPTDILWDVSGTLYVDELCFPDGRCVGSANEINRKSRIISVEDLGDCRKVRYNFVDSATPAEVCRVSSEVLGNKADFMFCYLEDNSPICSADENNSKKMNSCSEECYTPLLGTQYNTIEVLCCNQTQVRKIVDSGYIKDKVDIVIIGEGFSDDEFFDIANNIFGDGDGQVFGTEPYKELKNRFNVWAVNAGTADAPNRDNSEMCEWGKFYEDKIYHNFLERSIENYRLTFTDIEILLTSSKSMWPHGSFPPAKTQIVSTECRGNLNSVGRIITHETGHILGLLDEYVYTQGYGGRIGKPNCASNNDEAIDWWSDFEGFGQGDLAIGYYEGCTHDNAIRAVDNGIMRNERLVYLRNQWERGYGEYNINYLREEILGRTK